MIDPSEPLSDLDILLQSLANYQEKITPIINKTDIASSDQIENISAWLTERLANKPLRISAKSTDGIAQVRELLHNQFKHITVANDQVMVTNIRQAEALYKASEALQNVSEGISLGLSGDLLAQDLRAATSALGEVIGEVTTDDLLGNIFANFCIGK